MEGPRYRSSSGSVGSGASASPAATPPAGAATVSGRERWCDVVRRAHKSAAALAADTPPAGRVVLAGGAAPTTPGQTAATARGPTYYAYHHHHHRSGLKNANPYALLRCVPSPVVLPTDAAAVGTVFSAAASGDGSTGTGSSSSVYSCSSASAWDAASDSGASSSRGCVPHAAAHGSFRSLRGWDGSFGSSSCSSSVCGDAAATATSYTLAEVVERAVRAGGAARSRSSARTGNTAGAAAVCASSSDRDDNASPRRTRAAAARTPPVCARHHPVHHITRPGACPRFLCAAHLVSIHRATVAAVAATLRHAHRPCFAMSGMACARQLTFDDIPLSEGGVALRDTPNAGGASVRSEVLSFEVLRRVFAADLRATEMQVWYYPRGGNITDYVCTIAGATVGVSVTRAFHHLGAECYTAAEARRLLAKKLQGALNATRTVLHPEFRRQILHVWCPTAAIADMLRREYRGLRADAKGNTVVLVTVAPAEWLYNERLAHAKKDPAAAASVKCQPPLEAVYDSAGRRMRSDAYRQRRRQRRDAQRRARRAAWVRRCVAAGLRAVPLVLLFLMAAAWLAVHCGGFVT